MPIEPTVFSLLLTPPPLRIFATLENSRHPPPLRVKIFSFTDSRPIDHFSKSAGFSKSLTVFSFVCFAQGQKKKILDTDQIRIQNLFRRPTRSFHLENHFIHPFALVFDRTKRNVNDIYIYKKQWKFFSEKNSTHKHRRFDDT